MDDADDDHQSRELLAAAGDAELRCLLYGVDGVVPANAARSPAPWKSAPEQEAREIGGGERVQHLADHLAAARGDDGP